MDVTFAPEIEARLNELARHLGKTPAELVELVVVSMIEDTEYTRTVLDSRNDAVRRGEVRLVPADEVEAHFAEKYKSAKGLSS